MSPKLIRRSRRSAIERWPTASGRRRVLEQGQRPNRRRQRRAAGQADRLARAVARCGASWQTELPGVGVEPSSGCGAALVLPPGLARGMKKKAHFVPRALTRLVQPSTVATGPPPQPCAPGQGHAPAGLPPLYRPMPSHSTSLSGRASSLRPALPACSCAATCGHRRLQGAHDRAFVVRENRRYLTGCLSTSATDRALPCRRLSITISEVQCRTPLPSLLSTFLMVCLRSHARAPGTNVCEADRVACIVDAPPSASRPSGLRDSCWQEQTVVR